LHRDLGDVVEPVHLGMIGEVELGPTPMWVPFCKSIASVLLKCTARRHDRGCEALAFESFQPLGNDPLIFLPQSRSTPGTFQRVGEALDADRRDLLPA
jgi:hypothetical protein